MGRTTLLAMQRVLQLTPQQFEVELEREFDSVALRRLCKHKAIQADGTADEVRTF